MDDRHDYQDDQLKVLLGRAVEWPRDDGFSAAVMTRIERRLRTRRAVLGVAVAAGAVIALVPAYDILALLSARLGEIGVLWADLQTDSDASPSQYLALAVGLPVALLSPFLLRVIDE